MGNRIGFLLATLHQGSGANVWKLVANEALKHKNDAIFLFPGGRLDFPAENEYLKNQIYSLANEHNLDGAIIWSSTLTGAVSADTSATFVENKANRIPIVSIGQKVEGIPSVDFDAYSGLYNLVLHFIRKHGARKIAFLRGPEYHLSAERRFQAYKDALKDNGIAYDARLVSSPYPWSEGEKAIRELVEERNLRPGLDFDTLISPSDMMLFYAAKYLEEQCVLIPDQLRTAGFNDSEENILNSVAATTVKMPIKALVSTSFSKLLSLVENSDEPVSDVMLPSSLVLRESCGCADSFGGEENARKVITDFDSLKAWLSRNLDSEPAYLAIVTILENLYIRPGFIREERLRDLSEQFFSSGGTSSILLESIKWTERILGLSMRDAEAKDRLYAIAMQQMSRISAMKAYERHQVTKKLNSFKNGLLSVSTLDHLIDSISSSLPPLGIEKAFLLLYKDDDYTTLRGGFDKDNIIKTCIDFSRDMLLDDAHQAELGPGVFVIEPLNYLNQELGYILMKVSSAEGFVLEDVRSSISSSLKGVSLFENEAKRSELAEEAEKKVSEFYANLSEGLKEPLSALASLVEAPSVDKDALLANVLKAEHLLELSMTERGEESIDCSIISPSMIISAIEADAEILASEQLPAIYADKKRLSDALKIIIDYVKRSGDAAVVSFSSEPAYFSIRISGRNNIWKPAMMENDPSLLLFERIILMHFGSFSFSSNGIGLCLPYPALSGRCNAGSGNGTVLYIASDLSRPVPASIEKLDVITMSEDDLIQSFSLPASAVAIAWDGNDEHKKGNIILNLLKNHKDTKELPFLFFGLKKEMLSLSNALELSSAKSDKASIISFGKFPEALSKLAEFGNVQEVRTLDDALSSDGECGLIILYSFDISLVGRIRSSKKFIHSPILIIKDAFDAAEAEALKETPNVLIVNTCILESDDFVSRLVSVFGGGELLPPLTSALVKKSIAYLNKNASLQISRWQLAAAVNISEDYLTRIFRKEIGISPWDYLNRYRIQLASVMLTQTGASVNEIARDIGFQDQAYFCRVFKKVKGFPPGHLRARM